MARLHVSCCALLILATTATKARAEGSPQANDDADTDLRIAWLEHVVERERAGMTTWHGAWATVYGTVMVAEGLLYGIAKANNPNASAAAQASDIGQQRVDAGVELGKAAIAFASVIVSAERVGPVVVFHPPPVRTAEERKARLRLAESRLEHIAEVERAGRGLVTLIGGAVLNAAGAWITEAAYPGQNSARGWIGAVAGLAVAQIQFHTQPTGAIRALEAYRRAGAGARLGEPPTMVRWSLRPSAAGVALQAAF